MGITEAEFIAANTVEKLNFWEISGIALWAFLGLSIFFFILCKVIKHWGDIKMVARDTDYDDYERDYIPLRGGKHGRH